MNNLKNLGYSTWFETRTDQDKLANHEIARVVSVHKDSYLISKGGNNIFSELSGNLLYTANLATDLPTTGDWVYANFYDDESHGIIYGILPRKSLLRRKAIGKLVDVQLIAANIDVAFIVQSLNDNFNLRRLERYLVMVNDSGIEPVILLSKCDLISPDELTNIKESVLKIAPKTKVIEFSNETQKNIDSIIALLNSGLSYCLLGSSGVGKTTLLNNVISSVVFKVQEVSSIKSKGRHTTTSRQLVRLKSGAMIIDTPGMRELGNISTEGGLDETFSDIREILEHCKFANCSHVNEKGCAVQAAIISGKLTNDRYQSHLKLQQESDFNQMSYLEKKRKDKNLSKLIKSTIKHKKR